jgi:hypothetical protein
MKHLEKILSAPLPMSAPVSLLVLVLMLVLMLMLAPTQVLAARDPLEPPAAARALVPAPAGGEPAAADPVVRHIVTVDGRRWVLDGARRYSVGDRMGTLRIECIHDAAVTVRDDAGARRRLPLFGGVVIKPSEGAAPRPADDCPASASKNSKRSSR